ncbi:sec-independent translocase [Streptomyces sp. CBMA152]|uniref:sec-independent translocase n=1 Tax=Streptomyces sp. CBMA152 TaxID=1896312 RepID=UPI001661857F|nr:sec-independent translocase [Streptomyces sp. CBMA152]MBD0742434.1 preprotein translocase [Streptomyces sp. CBMA152]
MFTDVGPMELVTIAILAVLLFGPDKLPEVIRNVTGFLRKIREFSDNAKQEIRSELGPEFKDFDFEDLHPKTFVRKHVLNGEGDGLGLDEIRSALDPRPELAEVADAVRGAADSAAGRGSTAGSDQAGPTPTPVRLTKDGAATPPAHPAFDPDAT